MARVANMPHVYPEKGSRNHKDKHRFEYRRRWPTDVREVIGKRWFIYKFPQGVTEAQANEVSHAVATAFLDACQAVRANRAVPVLDMRGYRTAILSGTHPAPYTNGTFARSRIQIMAANTPGLVEVGGGTYVLNDDAVAPPAAVVSLDLAIADWKKKHGVWRDVIAEKKAEGAKRRAAEALFAVAKTADMAAIDTLTIQGWMDGLHDPRQAYDYVSDVKNLYSRLDANNRLPRGNPCGKIETPKKPEHTERGEFSDERAALVLASALASIAPIIKWGHMLAAFTGAIISEIVYAQASEFKQIDGVWVWDMRGRKLKTNHRARVIPLHAALIRAGFLDYVHSRDGRLFDIDNTQASGALMEHLRRLGIEGRDQVNYSWRHSFISRLVATKTEPTLRRYLDGHGLGGRIDEKHYIHHHLPEMVEAIGSLKDPTSKP
jgi:hypothetical protein